MVKVNSPYRDQTVFFGTVHKKEEVIAPLLLEYGIKCIPVNINSDSLGTFSGEIQRKGSVIETMRAKIKLTMQMVPDGQLFLASEGSFGSHPSLTFLNINQESLLFFDKKNNLEIIATDTTYETNMGEIVLNKKNRIDDFLIHVKFPSHGIVLQYRDKFYKGITDYKYLIGLVSRLFRESNDSTLKLITDMRANYNPTRMKFIGVVGEQLVDKILSQCPVCNSPGFSIVQNVKGLPCGNCDSPTSDILYHVLKCQKCNFVKNQKRIDKIELADPSICDKCNP